MILLLRTLRMIYLKVGELIEGIAFKMAVGKSMKEHKRYDWKGVVCEGVALASAFDLADFLPCLIPLSCGFFEISLSICRHVG